MADQSLCKIDSCGKKHLARGYCESHYRRWKRHGDPRGGGVANGYLGKWIDEVAMAHKGQDCLIWPFARDKDGYPQGGHPLIASKRAYRVVCELHNGPPPSEVHEASHSCGKGHEGCISPVHLSWKTHDENEADKVLHGTIVKGSRHVNARLSEADVRAIRQMFGTATHAAIAERFGVNRATVSMISIRRTWAWLE